MNYVEQWKKLLSPVRWHSQSEGNFAMERNPFMMDFDRIIFSSSYRRLAKKTQVHPLSRNDHIHNRLSHSQEVACVGRSLGIKIGFFLSDNQYLPCEVYPFDVGAIVQCASLVHDIGNPPFGHAGEDAICDWFRDNDNKQYLDSRLFTNKEIADFRVFDGNAQGFRVINCTEMYQNDGGLRLTFPTIASMVKYPRSAYEAIGMDSDKFNFYLSEERYFSEIFEQLGLKKDGKYLRHPLSYLTEAADDICYRIIDMEDAKELNIITFEEIKKVCEPIYDRLKIDKDKEKSLPSERRKLAYLRSKLINYLVSSIYETFVSNFDSIMNGEIKDLISIGDADVKSYFDNARDIFNNKISKDRTKITLEIGSYELYKRLLDVFIPSIYRYIKNENLSFKEKRVIDLMGNNTPSKETSLYEAYRCVIDFISGMTDFRKT